MLSVLIVEDDHIQRKNLVKMICEADKNLDIYEAESMEEALNISKGNYINFFYIDIFLKDSSGLDLASELRKMEIYKFTWIIFITTHVKYMIQAFKEIHCYDYIIKPYRKEEIIETTRFLISGKYKYNIKEDKNKCVVFVLQNSVSVKLNIDEIFFIEVNLRKVTLHTKKGKYQPKKMSLAKVLTIINADYILQSHKSFAVNVKLIDKVESISSKLWKVSFANYEENALLSYKFKDTVTEVLEKNI
ncbi:LytTR family DNA-binding domain-containing protein [Clostridium sp. JS66]|uniref:LytR/AlgR family response regulator transcription factor n=1 Tax=Clostridium sp. JS66 TaxID=3064705 RepID=UPI00298DAE1F|nr:LytTR family DNA-binding domain-containing protein [Clostridium sp. JS66]WPC42126.1 LytTR family DNA-binding domain-containing protein [Clostridium sp. JS66]